MTADRVVGVDVLSRIAAAWGDDSPEYRVVNRLIEEAQATLDHVEDESVDRIDNQCTLCHNYRIKLHTALANARGAKS